MTEVSTERLNKLSVVERNVLTLAGRGHTPGGIAKDLRGGLTEARVEEMLVEIRFKLDGGDGAPTVDYLVDLATREHQAAVKSGHDMIEHAIAAGDALIRARAQVPAADLNEWMATTFAALPAHASRAYMKLARHRELVRRSGVQSVRDALKLLVEASGPEAALRIHEIRGQRPGQSRRDIAEQAGVSLGHVDRVREREMAAKRRDQQEQERQTVVMGFGGPVAQAWVSTSMALEQVDAALTEQVSTPAQRRDLTAARGRLRRVHDDLASVAREGERRAA